MIFEDYFRQLLIALNVTGRNVYLILARQEPGSRPLATPYMVFQHVGPIPRHVHQGPLNLMERDYQVSLYCERQSLALSMADYLRNRLDGMRGQYMDVDFGGIFYRTQTTRWESETKLFQVVQEYRILYRIIGSTMAVHTAVPKESK